MIKIIDGTLTILDSRRITAAQAGRFLELLHEVGVEAAAISPGIYRLLSGTLPGGMTYYLEQNGIALQHQEYPGIDYFISNYYEGYGKTIRNYQLNELVELRGICADDPQRKLRLTGLDDLLTYESERIYERAMAVIMQLSPIVYPEDTCCCATAIAVSYLQHHSGGTVMATFTGIGGKAATEQVMVAMRVLQRYKPNQSLKKLRELRNLFEEMTGKKVSPHAPVVGERVFYVESGIHVDGVLKKPSNYESYPPELVGAERKIIMGKHSGKASVKHKLLELGMNEAEFDVERILEQVKRLGIKKGGEVDDLEFQDIARRCRTDA